jgi:hypothetical protein
MINSLRFFNSVRDRRINFKMARWPPNEKGEITQSSPNVE